jgi:putative SOS response-associated peptidase YedK
MCGRFFLSRSGAEIARHFALGEVPELAPRFNIAPGQPIAMVRAVAGEEAARELVLARWGLVPAWAKDARGGSRPINARVETAAELPMFRDALAHRRGLVPADGFYEWQHRGRSGRPFAVRVRDGRIFAMAAIWERWRGPEGPIESCAILTCPANARLGAIHDRMPVILAVEDYAAWLDPARRGAELTARLVPLAAEAIELHPVDRRVNDPREDDARLVEPERDLFSGRSEA